MKGRRLFLGQAGMTIAAAVAAALPDARGFTAVLPRTLPAALNDVDAGWHVDDMWGPRYAAPVPYLHVATAPDLAAHVAPADLNFVV